MTLCGRPRGRSWAETSGKDDGRGRDVLELDSEECRKEVCEWN